jgi:hypothetical protein
MDNHRQPILRFLSLAGSGYGMDQAWLWRQSGKARLDLVGFGIRLDQVQLYLGLCKQRFSHIWDWARLI